MRHYTVSINRADVRKDRKVAGLYQDQSQESANQGQRSGRERDGANYGPMGMSLHHSPDDRGSTAL
jgi:hypothetical protein